MPSSTSLLETHPPTTPAAPDAATPDSVTSVEKVPANRATARAAVDLPPKPANTRYQSLDFWRGAACLMLFGFHTSFYADRTFVTHDMGTWSPGSVGVKAIRLLWIGVPIFFVISGYCIAASIDSLRRRPHSLGDYFVRRFRRIYPPLWIASSLTVVFLLCLLLQPDLLAACEQLTSLFQVPFSAWVGNFTATETWLPRVTGRTEPTFLMNNTWTLCYEEQFYVVTGVLLAFSARRFFAGCAVVTLLTLAARHLGRLGDFSWQGVFLDGHWLPFAVGILVYYGLHYASPRGRIATALTLVAGMLYAVLDRRTQSARFETHLDDYILVACAFGLALLLARPWDAWFASWRILRPVTWCGRMSYSIYLLHFPLVVALSCWLSRHGFHDDHSVAFYVLPAALAVSLPLSWLFHVAVERRFMNA
ncbi:MAG: acyltransferase [Pirellulales bacterium]